MSAIGIDLIGRFGNQLFQYAGARAIAEKQGLELRTNPWVGQQIFEINDAPLRGDEEMLRGYFQDQKSLIYTRADARRWFTFRKGIDVVKPRVELAAHYRGGDYKDCGYVVVSKKATLHACSATGFNPLRVQWAEESPGREWLDDFLMMMHAEVLFRSNSTFSWWAATLGDGRVFSPIITGLKGGVEYNEVPFAIGNHPRFCELEFVTDLHLKES